MGKFNVLIDLDRLKDPYNGLGQSAINLGEAFSKLKDEVIRFTFLVPESYQGRFGDAVDYEVITSKRRYLPWLCRTYDLWYTIHQDSWYFPSRTHTPYVLTINDLNFLGEKTGLNRKYRLKRLQLKVNRARVVTTISNFSAGEINKHLVIKGKEVKVIYFGIKVFTFDQPEKPAYVPEGRLLFAVGVIQPKKNYGVLIDFISHLPQDYVLVIAGNKHGDHSAELELKIREAGLENRIILPGMISDKDKYWHFLNCEAVLFPSKLEGMGYPPIEAMRCGKPVFASTYSSIPEVCGDKAYYWQRFEPEYMAEFFLEKMKEHRGDPGRSEELKAYSMRYTWDHVAEEYLGLFKSILKGDDLEHGLHR